jgi:hypothetical protein
MTPDYDWIIYGEEKEPLAYKKPNEEPVFIDAEAAVLRAIETMKTMNTVNINTSNLLSDLSRHLY